MIDISTAPHFPEKPPRGLMCCNYTAGRRDPRAPCLYAALHFAHSEPARIPSSRGGSAWWPGRPQRNRSGLPRPQSSPPLARQSSSRGGSAWWSVGLIGDRDPLSSATSGGRGFKAPPRHIQIAKFTIEIWDLLTPLDPSCRGTGQWPGGRRQRRARFPPQAGTPWAPVSSAGR
jgi:hypothetical protein